MPDPCDYDSESEFHSACVSARRHEHPDESIEQSNAACYSIWDNRECDKSMKTLYKAGIQSSSDPYEYVMSTDTVDRMGDIVSQDWNLSAFKSNPIALWQHNAEFPIGTWEKVRVESGKLIGRLKLAKEGTSDLIDTLRSLIEQRILKAVSVGFRPGKAVPLDEDDPWGGYRLSQNELMECSLVSVPANPEAVSLSKSIPSTLLLAFAATGDPCHKSACEQIRGEKPSHDSDPKPETQSTVHRNRPMKKSLSEKIEIKQNHINDLKNQLTELDNSYDADEDMPEEVMAQYDELSAKIDRAESELMILRKAEGAMAQRAAEQAQPKEKAVVPVVPIQAKPVREKGFRAIATLAALVKAHCDRASPIAVAEQAFKDDPEIVTLTRAATDPATMTDAAWAAPLVRETWGEFLELIRDMAIFPNLPGMRLEFDRFGKINIPRNVGRGQLAGGWTDEGAPIPVKEGAYDTVDLAPKTMAVISTFTKQIGMHSMPAIQGLIQDQMLGDTAEAIDTFYMDNVARSASRPAGMQDTTETGAGNINAATGATVANIIADLKAMIQRLLAARAGNNAVWVMNPLNVLNLRSVQDAASGEFVFRAELDSGMLFGYPLIVSQNIAVDLILLQGTQAVAYGNDYAPMIDVSDEATIVFDDTAPEHIVDSGTPTTQPVKSMFQTLSIAVRMSMGMDWRIVRTGGVQVLTGVAWS